MTIKQNMQQKLFSESNAMNEINIDKNRFRSLSPEEQIEYTKKVLDFIFSIRENE